MYFSFVFAIKRTTNIIFLLYIPSFRWSIDGLLMDNRWSIYGVITDFLT